MTKIVVTAKSSKNKSADIQDKLRQGKLDIPLS